jgi:hypothetical protein
MDLFRLRKELFGQVLRKYVERLKAFVVQSSAWLNCLLVDPFFCVSN